MSIIRVMKTEFELSTGEVFPIVPPLDVEMSVKEFQKHYDYAIEVIRSCGAFGGDNSDSS